MTKRPDALRRPEIAPWGLEALPEAQRCSLLAGSDTAARLPATDSPSHRRRRRHRRASAVLADMPECQRSRAMID